jgi:hypothetical protein
VRNMGIIQEPLYSFKEEVDMFGFDMEQWYYSVDISFRHLPRTKLIKLKQFLVDMGWMTPDGLQYKK